MTEPTNESAASAAGPGARDGARGAQPQVVRSYLSQLESALHGVPVEVAAEIAAGIAEELAGLDAATAATRIEELGDPMFIAAEARAEAGVAAGPGFEGTLADAAGVGAAGGTPTAAGSAHSGAAAAGHGHAATTRPGADPRWYTVLASLLVALGGVVIPILGWIVGIAMVWLSKTWHSWEKWVATTVPLGVGVLAGLVSVVGSTAGRQSNTGSLHDDASSIGAFKAPTIGDFTDRPGLPVWFDVWWSSLLMIVLLNVVVGIWLLWRALRR